VKLRTAPRGEMSRVKPIRALRRRLDELYGRYNRREYVHPDPLEFLYRYEDLRDREIAGLVASALAYGRVAQILRSVSHVLDRMESPAAFVGSSDADSLRRDFRGFKHRFTTGEEMASMLLGVKRMIDRYGSLESCFCSGLAESDDSVLPALRAFTSQINSSVGLRRSSLVPLADDGSACKRLNLYLRWMVRRDGVDPGGWDRVPASRLIVPLDTHMHRLSLAMGLTSRKQANMCTAMEVTAAFREMRPDDPVRYDFALTRLGIRDELRIERWLSSLSPRTRGAAAV
jgi:uncharacterized protein (TIGR02757 family)